MQIGKKPHCTAVVLSLASQAPYLAASYTSLSSSSGYSPIICSADQLENKIDRNAEASHCRLPSTDVGIDFDAIKCHKLRYSFLIRDAIVKGYR
jgi:hypothetical protein